MNLAYMKALHKFVTKIEPPNWVLVIMGLTLLARIPSFFEPYFYGDEMIYLTLGNAIRSGLTLYKQIHDNKPPLLYITAAIAGNLFWFKAILAIWMMVTTAAFWHLTKNLFKEKFAQRSAVIAFAVLTTIPLFEGNIVNAELFLIGPIILGLVFLLNRPSYRNIFIAGLLFSVAALYKIPAIFDLPVIIIYWLITLKDGKEIKKIIIKSFILIIGFIIPILLTLIWYFLRGAMSDYIRAAFLENLGYISTWNTVQNQSFVVKHGSLLIRAGIVIIGLIILRVYNTKLSKVFLISSIWLLTSLFAVTLSERPYPHYFIQAVPSVSILIGILISSVRFEQVLTIIPLTLAIFVPFYYKFYYYSTSAYYWRFFDFATHQTSKWDYFNSFDAYTEGNYKVSEFLNKTTTLDEKVFIWGDTAPIMYALSRRLPPIKYVATYHIDSFTSRTNVINEFELNPPKTIVIPPNSPNFIELMKFVGQRYVLIYNQDNFEVWKLVMR